EGGRGGGVGDEPQSGDDQGRAQARRDAQGQLAPAGARLRQVPADAQVAGADRRREGGGQARGRCAARDAAQGRGGQAAAHHRQGRVTCKTGPEMGGKNMPENNLKPGGAVEKKEVAAPRRVTYTPRVDILETPEEMWLYVDLPGVKANDVEVNFERGELTVHGKTQPAPAKGQSLLEESEPGDFYRAFLISQDIATDKIEAELK